MIRDNRVATFNFKKNVQFQFTKYSGLSTDQEVTYKLIEGAGSITKYKNFDYFVVEFNTGTTSLIEMDQVSSVNLDITEEK